MKYLVMKSGHRFVLINEDGTFNLVKSINDCSKWPVEFQDYVEEGMDRIRESGISLRVHVIEDKS